MIDHPITPPPELMQQWANAWHTGTCTQELLEYIATQAARWGSDQELEACCEEMKSIPSPLGIPFGEMASNALRAARRPKPPSLKQQALKAFSAVELMAENYKQFGQDVDTIRRALEALPDD